MATSSRIHVMISSRCNDKFPANAEGRSLSEIRMELKAEIEKLEVFGKRVFKVWINEDAPPKSSKLDSSERCFEIAKDCDIFITLSNGDAGWAVAAGGIGICHAELATAFSRAPGKVWLIALGNTAVRNTTPQGERNGRFQHYVREELRPFRGGKVSTEDELKTRVREALHDALVTLAHAGVSEAGKGQYHTGESLDWTRMSFKERRKQMREVLRDALHGRAGARYRGSHLFVRLADTDILFVVDAVPAAMSVAAAREMVGQPFLHDHTVAGVLKEERGGPVHIIGCQKNATEGQAIKLLGFPDATVVNTPFGIFVADNISKVQFAFIVNCRDDATTRLGVQRFFRWLEQAEEEPLVAACARARARIVAAIAKEAKV